MSEQEKEVEEMEIDWQMLSPLNHSESGYYDFPLSPQSLFHSDFLPWPMSPRNHFESGCNSVPLSPLFSTYIAYGPTYSVPLSPLFSTDIAYGLTFGNLSDHIDHDFGIIYQLGVASKHINFHHPPSPDYHNSSLQEMPLSSAAWKKAARRKQQLCRQFLLESDKLRIKLALLGLKPFCSGLYGKQPNCTFVVRYYRKRLRFTYISFICRPKLENDNLYEVTEVGDASYKDIEQVKFQVNLDFSIDPFCAVLSPLPPSDYCHVAAGEKPVDNLICYKMRPGGWSSSAWVYGPPSPLTRAISGSHFKTSGPSLVLSFQSTGLVNFRVISLHYMFTIDSTGLSSHVFWEKLPGLNLKMQYYSSKECPQLIHGLLVFPIFEISGGRCVGVIEPSSASQMVSYALEIGKISKALKVGDVRNINSLQENLEILTVLSEIYKLPLVRTRDPSDYCHAFGHYALDFCFGSCLVSPMHNPTGINSCFLELRLPHQLKDLKDQHNFLETLLATVKHYFQCYGVTFVNILEGERYVAIIDVPEDERLAFRLESITTYQSNTSGIGQESYKMEKADSVERQPVLKLDSVNERRRINDRQEKNQDTISNKRKKATLEDLQQLYELPQNDAAEYLGVSRSTLKRLCREYGIDQWPYFRKKRVNGGQNREHVSRSHTSHSCDLHARLVGKSTLHTQEIVFQQRESSLKDPLYVQPETSVGGNTIQNIDTLERSRTSHPLGAKDQVVDSINTICPGSSQPGNQVMECFPSTSTNIRVAAVQDTRIITIRATYKDHIIKFPLSTSSGIEKLQEEVRRRLVKLGIGPFTIKYLDSDNDWVLIACDDDLQSCLSTCTTSVIQMSIQSNLLR